MNETPDKDWRKPHLSVVLFPRYIDDEDQGKRKKNSAYLLILRFPWFIQSSIKTGLFLQHQKLQELFRSKCPAVNNHWFFGYIVSQPVVCIFYENYVKNFGAFVC